MNILNKSSCYTAGAIDNAHDHGKGWRQQVDKHLTSLGITVLDPTNKPGGVLSETSKEQDTIKKMKSDKNYKGLKNFMKKIRRYDLRLIDNADFVIAYIDTSIHMCGTYDEVFTAEDQQKPIFYIVKGGIETLSSWMFAVINDFDMVFDTVEDCLDYIDKINKGEIELSDKWVLFKHLIES